MSRVPISDGILALCFLQKYIQCPNGTKKRGKWNKTELIFAGGIRKRSNFGLKLQIIGFLIIFSAETFNVLCIEAISRYNNA